MKIRLLSPVIIILYIGINSCDEKGQMSPKVKRNNGEESVTLQDNPEDSSSNPIKEQIEFSIDSVQSDFNQLDINKLDYPRTGGIVTGFPQQLFCTESHPLLYLYNFTNPTSFPSPYHGKLYAITDQHSNDFSELDFKEVLFVSRDTGFAQSYLSKFLGVTPRIIISAMKQVVYRGDNIIVSKDGDLIYGFHYNSEIEYYFVGQFKSDQTVDSLAIKNLKEGMVFHMH